MVKKTLLSGKTLPMVAAVMLGLGAFAYAYTTSVYCYEGRNKTVTIPGTTAPVIAAAEQAKAKDIAKPRPGYTPNHDGACTPADDGPSTPGAPN